jgi:uncharacterized membrane protein YphA (DoxX/SURF4 family)
MNKTAFYILRVGLAITFIWVGVLILRSPDVWASFIAPWAKEMLLISPKSAIVATAIFDIVVGLAFLIDFWVLGAAVFASLHLISVFAVAGIDETTVRDIGLLAGSIALFIEKRRSRPSFQNKINS